MPVKHFPVKSLLFCILVVLISLPILTAKNPGYRSQKIFFGDILPIFQKMKGLHKTSPSFVYEKPEALQDLREYAQLDSIGIDDTDFETWLSLMHWARDQFPHGEPEHEPPSQSFDGLKVLKEKTGEAGFLCGTASQLLIQAITSVGGYARRVELRSTPKDKHAVVEAWSDFYDKWIVLDPDYDVYYTKNDIPLHALELHKAWANKDIGGVEIHWRDSPYNIYKPDGTKPRFQNKLLNYYAHLSYPLRNDWKARPLPWWHPEGNHVQNSLVIDLPTMENYEDFTLKTTDVETLYRKP